MIKLLINLSSFFVFPVYSYLIFHLKFCLKLSTMEDPTLKIKKPRIPDFTFSNLALLPHVGVLIAQYQTVSSSYSYQPQMWLRFRVCDELSGAGGWRVLFSLARCLKILNPRSYWYLSPVWSCFDGRPPLSSFSACLWPPLHLAGVLSGDHSTASLLPGISVQTRFTLMVKNKCLGNAQLSSCSKLLIPQIKKGFCRQEYWNIYKLILESLITICGWPFNLFRADWSNYPLFNVYYLVIILLASYLKTWEKTK